jgi:DNA polymerase III delta prime subunit
MKRVDTILTNESIDFDKKVVAELIMKHFPDWRRVINELQRYSASGKIDTGILVNMSEENYKKLVEHLRSRNWKDMRKWVGSNSDIEPTVLYRKLYDTASQFMADRSIPQLVLLIANYSYKSAFVADQEVNFVACLTEIMSDCEFK